MNWEEAIPAFSMWKMFNQTVVPTLLNMDYSDSTLQKLVNVVKTKEFFSIFVYNHDPSKSYEEYQAMSEKYKSFTVWLLGRFYYLLSCGKLEKMHDFIIDAQWQILDKVSVTQPNVYVELCREYLSALQQLNNYHKNLGQTPSSNILLDTFKPQQHNDLQDMLDLSQMPVEITSSQSCLNMQKKTITFLHKILSKNIRLYHFDDLIYSTLEEFLYILEKCNFDLKLVVFQVYVDLLQINSFNCDKTAPFQCPCVDSINRFVCFTEQFVYNVFNKILITSKENLNAFENLLVAFLHHSNRLNPSLRITNIARFITSIEVTPNLKSIALDKACSIETQLPSALLQNISIEDCVKSFFDKDSYHLLKIVLKQVIYEVDRYLRQNEAKNNINIEEVSSTWNQLYQEMKNILQKNLCTAATCRFLKNITFIKYIVEESVYMKILFHDRLARKEPSDFIRISFFLEYDILIYVINIMNNHFATCHQPKTHSEIERAIQTVLTYLPILYVTEDIEFIFYCIANPFFKTLNIKQYIKCQDKEFIKRSSKCFTYLQSLDFSQEVAVEHLTTLLNNLSSGIIFINNRTNKIEKIKDVYFGIVKQFINEKRETISDLVFRRILYVPTIFTNRNQWILEIFIPLLYINLHHNQLLILIEAISNFICKSSTNNVEVILWNNREKTFAAQVYCTNCVTALRTLSNKNETFAYLLDNLHKLYKDSIVILTDVYPPLSGDTKELDILLQNVLSMFQHNHDEVKISLIRALKAFKHIPSFNTVDTSIWLNCLKDVNIEVGMQLSRVIKGIQDIQETTKLSKQYKEEVLKMCFNELKQLTKLSLQTSNYEVQDLVLECLGQISTLEGENVTLYCADLLLYFIMVSSSKYPLIAADFLIKMATQRNTTTNIIFLKHKNELSFRIVQLCALNQSLVGYTLATSLENVSLILGFFGTKNFIKQECRSILPYFISLVTKMPEVEKLVKEIASFLDVELSELLINCYGNIFLHSLLNEPDGVFKNSVNYVEKHTSLHGSTLRKRNFQVILNELLLNFHEKRDRVLLALKILAKEDSEGRNLTLKQIQEYLQPKLLGVLAHFDIKLITRHSDKKKVLLSLAQLLRFMGAKHITPLRFKILAMLRTALHLNYEVFPELNCDVWDAFVLNCEIDALGPQLASIFISLLPLLNQFPHKIEEIFKYLIIKNEEYLKDYIPDLFFVAEMDINIEICNIIKNHLRRIECMPFKDQLKAFMKYLNHESVDIRVYGLKYLKILLEKNREELDHMVLGYNGIDATVVELLDILMLGCREKDESLKLACGECIGELGAIEPSHLPRRVTLESKSFTFFITEDSFIVNALNELIRALQAENNTHSMDRFALAIQEILKEYEISPEDRSKGHHIWNNFPEAQRQLMLPLLSSRYTMRHSVESTNLSPIYGSKFGSTYQTWIYNWACSLILDMNPQKTFLQVCLPSLKQDNKTLMHFLPYILLHALLESKEEVQGKIHDEFMAVLNSLSNKQLNPVVLTVQSYSGISPIQSASTEDSKENQCIKVIFVLIDFLDRWVRERIWKHRDLAADNEYHIIKNFLYRFSKIQLAQCNYQCGEYPRAFLYLEEHIKENPNDLCNHFAFIAKLYAQLDEPDGVAGVTALQDVEPPLEQRILALEVSGKLADATACYERIQSPLMPCHLQGLVQCYLDLDNVNTALNFTEGAMERHPEYKTILLEMQAEPLWRLGRYEELDKVLKKTELTNNNSWGVQIGRALLHLKNGERDAFKTVLNTLRGAQVESLGAASLQEGAYQHGYSYITRLHVINEFEHVEKIIYELLNRSNDHKVCESVLKQLNSEWELRLKVVQESIKTQEFILCLRRVAIEQAKQVLETKVPHSLPLLNSLLGKLWLCSANTARKLGIHQQGYTYTLKAEEYAPPRLFVEKAKLHWLREEHEQALTSLRRGLESMYDDINIPSTLRSNISLEDRKIAAEAKLLIASYNDSISNVDMDTNLQNYKHALEVYGEWEKSLVYLAQYYDRIFQTYTDAEKDTKGSDYQKLMITCFGKSLLYGSNYVYQSLPRLLSIWFDYGTRLLDVSDNSIKEERSATLVNMSQIIDTFSDRLPAYIFLTAFSQLVSRICHPQRQVYIELKSIIVKLILQYPQHSLWMIMSVIKSSYQLRYRRCAEILNESELKVPNMIKLVGDFTKLAEKLIELCNKELSDTIQVTSVKTLVRSLPRLLDADDFSEIMIPTQKFRKLILPNPDFNSSQHNPFPNHYVHIVGIEDEVTVLQSLQHPRKITFRGSDGKRYIQMLKPKDDLRKDFRLMEFNDIVNQLLSRDSESRQRRLNIRLYSVVPLNEECGLIEWVPNLVGLRPIVVTLYNKIGMGMKTRELKNMCSNPKDSVHKKREIFTKSLLPRHPPILGEWFRKTFPDAQTWFSAQTAYTRTTSVISMVGYILGLGDRHGENILLDSTCGDTIHVDFNCLFNKGETFEWPERVPFRLTHNMVAAMGPLGVEGIFRKSCACTLRVLRTHTNTLMSIVTPFVYDPLVSWPRHSAVNAKAQTSERTNDQAVDHIRNIRLRLQGTVRTKGRLVSIPLSVEGQANNLIQEALSIDNLCQMYYGWGPFL